jgi:hypothetical protein
LEVVEVAATKTAVEVHLAVRVAMPDLRQDLVTRRDERSGIAIAVRIAAAILPPGRVGGGRRRGVDLDTRLKEPGARVS